MDISVPKIIFENDDFAVIDKPAGMLVHPARPHEPIEGTIAGWLAQTWPETKTISDPYSQELKYGIVHRLDKETSGVMVIAKNQAAFEELKQQFQSRSVEKTYQALVWGKMPQESGTIVRPIAKSREGTKRTTRPREHQMVRPAQTEWRIMETLEDTTVQPGMPLTLLSLHPLTGRTHQLRVHCAAAGHPILGDYLYGGATSEQYRAILGRVFLHAATLSFSFKGITYSYSASLPEQLKRFLESLRPYG